jgi:hypothetical protein
MKVCVMYYTSCVSSKPRRSLLKFNEEEGQYKAVVKFFQEQRKYRKIHQDDSQDIRPHSTGFGSVWHYGVGPEDELWR